MWFPAVTTGAPSGDVISIDRAKEFLRVDDSSQDNTITDAVASAVQHVESYTSTRLLTETVELHCGSFRDFERLPIGPVQSISSITYLDTLGARQTLDDATYELFGAGLDSGIRPAFNCRWPTPRRVSDAITVTAIVGYGLAADVPSPIIDAIRLLIGDSYEVRGDTVLQRGVTPATLPNGVAAKLANFRL